MPRDIDGLTSPTLKHLRDHWWDEPFTMFLRDNLQPRAGTRILDVGCGTGTAEVQLGRLRLSQVDLFGVDLIPDRVRAAREAARGTNTRAAFAASDACRLPFTDGAFDSTFCVAVLQHVREIDEALAEFARVTRPGGRILAVEPDNSARYWYSSAESGRRAFEVGARFFGAVAMARGDVTDPAIGPKLPALFARRGIEPLSVTLFPVSTARLGAPEPAVWASRRESVQQAVDRSPDESIRRLGTDYLKLLDRYAEEAAGAGSGFVEIQNTMLFATLGRRPE